MSTSSGFSTSKKSLSIVKGYTVDQSTAKSRFQTIQPAGSDRVASDSCQRALYSSATGKIVSAATKRMIAATLHGASAGDVIKFTSGALSGMDFPVLSCPTSGIIIIESEFDTVPSASDTFDVFKWTFVQVSPTGSQLVTVAPSPIQIVKDGVATDVTLDTIAPHNHVPMPVCITDVTGTANVTLNAGDINVNIRHDGLDPSSVRLGDGTTLVGVTLANELKANDAQNAIHNIQLIDGDVADYTFDNTTGQTLYTGVAKKVRIVQNGGEMLYIYKNAAKVGALEAGGKIEFNLSMIVTDDLIIKSKSGTITTNICWNIFN